MSFIGHFFPCSNQEIAPRQTIVLLHGDTLNHRQWQPQIEFLRKEYDVIAGDLAGYGESPAPSQPVSHHQELFSFLQTEQLSSAHLIGSSLGGEIALDFAATYPTYVASLFLLSPSLSGFPSEVDWSTGATESSLAERQKNWLNHPVFRSLCTYPDAKQYVADMVQQYQGCYWQQPELRQKTTPPTSQQLHRIATPTTLVVGALDLPYFHHILQHLSNHLPISARYTIQESGHLPNLEQPNLINQLVANHLKSSKMGFV